MGENVKNNCVLFQEFVPTHNQNADLQGMLEIRRIELIFPDKNSEDWLQTRIKKPQLLYWKYSENRRGELGLEGQEKIDEKLAMKIRDWIQDGKEN